ncbi:MAG TPA: DUF4232 domain-containing protein [Aeromicrobium sp.]|nr:DUF4232 domain-containing protein [Aeromicrobium sp.]
MKQWATSIGALLAGVVLVGCGPGDPMTGRAGSDLPPGPLQPLPSETTSTPPPGCRGLEAGRGKTESQSDADFLDITLTNRSGEACTIHGYPTLTMRDGNGRGIGEPAGFRTSGAARYLILDPGETATATVRFPKTTGACTSGTVRIELLIPGATERAFISENHPYCPGWTVGAISGALD